MHYSLTAVKASATQLILCEILSAKAGLANFNPQEGHIIRKDSHKGRNCIYIYLKVQRKIGLLCAVLKVMSYNLRTFSLLIKLPYYVL